MDIPHGAVSSLRPTILIAEDDPGVRRSLQLLLRGQGYDVKAYFEGHPLLDDAQSLSAACLITDYRLGTTDGLAVLSRLRSRGWQGPAILITAFPSAALTRQAEEAGFNTVMEKPLKPHVLVSLLERLAPTS
jgi:FixJ family two-component response regulator